MVALFTSLIKYERTAQGYSAHFIIIVWLDIPLFFGAVATDKDALDGLEAQGVLDSRVV